MFGTFDKPSIFSAGYSTANEKGRKALSEAMICRVNNFIHSEKGNPNNHLGNKACSETDITHWGHWSPPDPSNPNKPNELFFDADNDKPLIEMKYRSPESKPDEEPEPKECTNNK